jgi:hypothetical protein
VTKPVNLMSAIGNFSAHSAVPTVALNSYRKSDPAENCKFAYGLHICLPRVYSTAV